MSWHSVFVSTRWKVEVRVVFPAKGEENKSNDEEKENNYTNEAHNVLLTSISQTVSQLLQIDNSIYRAKWLFSLLYRIKTAVGKEKKDRRDKEKSKLLFFLSRLVDDLLAHEKPLDFSVLRSSPSSSCPEYQQEKQLSNCVSILICWKSRRKKNDQFQSAVFSFSMIIIIWIESLIKHQHSRQLMRRRNLISSSWWRKAMKNHRRSLRPLSVII